MTDEGSYRVVERCRVCDSHDLWKFLSLGDTPLANSFVAPDRRSDPEPRFPLELLRCSACGLVQLSIVVRPELMFRQYLYVSSASQPLLRHFASYADEIRERFAPRGALVVEIGSNDGILLRPLRERGIHAVGVEPSINLAALANEAGLETVNDFFSSDAAARVASAKGLARVVVANNVLGHIDDLMDAVTGVDGLLDRDGVLVAEFPYLVDLLGAVEYDTVYHEHLSYFSVGTLIQLFSRTGLELFDVRHLPIHGGSLRIFVGKKGRRPIAPSVGDLRASEERTGLTRQESYERFADRVRTSRDTLVTLLSVLRSESKSIAALGATAKGNTLLNYCQIGPDLVEFVADSTPLKQGLLTPGMHIRVRPEGSILEERPDITLLLAWNYVDAILERYSSYVEAGGRFIHPIPLARLVP